MKFSEAKEVVLSFGKYRGKTIDDVAATDDGLRYLDWLAGQDWVNGRTEEALAEYLGNDAVKRDLETLLDD